MGTPGFCGLKNGGPGAKGAMTTTDPNADLIGLRFPVDTGGEGIVTGTASWNEAYVTVATPTGATTRVASQVRRRKELS